MTGPPGRRPFDPHLGPVLEVSGADLLDGTPILDIKPYVEADCHPEAERGFTATNTDYALDVVIPDDLAARLPARTAAAARASSRRVAPLPA